MPVVWQSKIYVGYWVIIESVFSDIETDRAGFLIYSQLNLNKFPWTSLIGF
jgi:hypothetical protein